MPRELTIEQRVDILLKEGVDKPKKWAKVHGYAEPSHLCDDCPTDWREEWKRLREHHLDETYFLFDVIRELAKRCGVPTSKTD
jgi:hypothetical protein